jgi:lipoate-protein ligase B
VAPHELLVLDLGLREYGQAYEAMLRLHELRAEGQIPDALVLVEHPHVVTLGRRGTREQVFDPTLPVVEVERGGMATYHGPGQMVAYPIVGLQEAGWGVKQLVGAVAEAGVRALRDVGIDGKAGESKEAIGVWVGPKKIASIGLAVRRGVSLHGIAINVSTDLSYFARLQPCGMEASVMTSAAKLLGRAVPLGEVKESYARHFAALLGAQPRAATEADVVARLQC